MPATDASYSAIEDYAFIGDCGSAALISRAGAIDWLCWPRFDSPSVFGALLDARRGGTFQVEPAAPYHVARRYHGDTNVLETTFTTEGGAVRLTDLMLMEEELDGSGRLQAEHELLRVVEGAAGAVEVRVAFAPRFSYGRVVPRVHDRGASGFFCTYGRQVLVLRSDAPLERSGDGASLQARFTVRAGERYHLALAFAEGGPAALPLLGEAADAARARTVRYWEQWAARCRYDGPYRAAVLRSALALKLMTYAPSGAVVAAPTTSLPEHVGGRRNWDYRYCWLRDASFTMRSFLELGFEAEGDAFLRWLLHTTGWTSPRLHVLYDVHGGTHVRERTLDHLEGYRGSRPVRVGNGAQQQFQLDIYGEVISAAFEFVQRGGELDGAERRLLRDLGKTVCRRWQEPDNGIWELRTERRHHTYSKVMCWVALDRLLRLQEAGRMKVPVERFTHVRAAVRAAIEEHGYSEALGCYTDMFRGERMDASLLLLALYGYADPRAPRMRATYRRLQEELGRGLLVYRYPQTQDDGLPSGEGAFGICSFWAVAYLARAGEAVTAARRFEAMLSYGNDVGLLSEEIDPETGAALGNFPQAFTHVGLINAALTLAETGEARTEARLRADEAGRGGAVSGRGPHPS